MTESDLQILLQELCIQPREQQWLEFKLNKGSITNEQIGEYISAMSNGATIANKPFGYLVWGVEDETLSCGTGVTACALTASLLKGKNEWKIETAGGSLKVTSETNGRYFTNIRLSGPAVMAYRGEVYIAECE